MADAKGEIVKTDIEWKKFIWEILKGLALAAITVVTFITNKNAEETKSVIDSTKILLEQKNKQDELNMKAFEFVEKTFSLDPTGKSTEKGMAAVAIVNTLTKCQLRSGLLSALWYKYPGLQEQIGGIQQYNDIEAEKATCSSAPPSPEQNKNLLSYKGLLEKVSNYLIPSAQAQGGPQTVISNYRIDIFYCEGSSRKITENRERQAKDTKKKILKELSIEPRIRLLPFLVQATKPGYQVYADEIRYNEDENEKQIAEKISKIIKVETRNIDYKSPQYVSIFYCASKQ